MESPFGVVDVDRHGLKLQVKAEPMNVLVIVAEDEEGFDLFCGSLSSANFQLSISNKSERTVGWRIKVIQHFLGQVDVRGTEPFIFSEAADFLLIERYPGKPYFIQFDVNHRRIRGTPKLFVDTIKVFSYFQVLMTPIFCLIHIDILTFKNSCKKCQIKDSTIIITLNINSMQTPWISLLINHRS